MEIVLASGKAIRANEVLNPDLFWAMRGVSSEIRHRPHTDAKLHAGRRRNFRHHDLCYPQNFSRHARGRSRCNHSDEARLGSVLERYNVHCFADTATSRWRCDGLHVPNTVLPVSRGISYVIRRVT